MSVGYRSSSSTGDEIQASSHAPAVPDGAAAGDVVVVIVERWGGNSAIIPAAGFTQWPTQYLSGDAASNITLFWKRLIGSDAGSYSFSWTGTLWSHAHAMCMTGVVVAGTPIEAVNGWSGTAGTFGSTSVTTASIPGLIWTGYNDSVGTHTPPTGYTEVIDIDCGATGYRIGSATGTQTATGGSVTSSSPATAVLIALIPEGETSNDATLHGDLSSIEGGLSAVATSSGVVVGTLSEFVGALEGLALAFGDLTGTLPATNGGLTGSLASSGAFAGDLPTLASALLGQASSEGFLAGGLSSLAGGLFGEIEIEGGLLSGPLPSLSGSLAIVAMVEGTFFGALSSLDGILIAEGNSSGIFSGNLPSLMGMLTALVQGDGTGEFSGFLPTILMMSAAGRQRMREEERQREVTRRFIEARPIFIALTPHTETRADSGALRNEDGVPRPIQMFRAINMSHTERHTTSDGQGEMPKFDFTLLGTYDAAISPGDWWEDEEGQKWITDSLVPYNGYEKKAMITSYGWRP